MWILRILTGPLTGKKFELHEGGNSLGRAAASEIVIPQNGISKSHALLKVSGDSVELVDTNSSNGVFVNGVRIRARHLHNGDRISFADVIADIHEMRGVSLTPKLALVSQTAKGGFASQAPDQFSANQIPGLPEQFAQGSGLADHNQHSSHNPHHHSNQDRPADLKPKQWWSPAVNYVEDVVLPGIYRLGQTSDFKWVLISFIFIFSFLVTLLSTIPLLQITRSSIEQESQLRALGLAEHLADRFSQALQTGSIANVNLDSILRQKGVRAAYVIASNDGHIVAPASKAGNFSNDPFVNQARTRDQRFVDNISLNLIGASVPISQYNAERGRFEPQYDAVILYDIAGLAIDDGRVISLFVKVFTIAVLLGGILFFFLYRFVLYPITHLSSEIDRVMLEKRGEVKSTYKFPEMQKLAELVNSLVSRASYDDEDKTTLFAVDRISEVSNLVHFMNVASMACWGDGRVMAVNSAFGDFTGVREDYYRDKPIASFTSQSLTFSMDELIERAKGSPSQLMESAISISERDFTLGCQVFMKEDGPEYFLFFLRPVEA